MEFFLKKLIKMIYNILYLIVIYLTIFVYFNSLNKVKVKNII